MPRTLAGCGSEAAYKRHLDHDEPVDEACAVAHAEYGREWREKQRRAVLTRRRVAAPTGDALRVMCARLDAEGWSAGRIGLALGLSLEGVRGSVAEGRRILIARRRIEAGV